MARKKIATNRIAEQIHRTIDSCVTLLESTIKDGDVNLSYTTENLELFKTRILFAKHYLSISHEDALKCKERLDILDRIFSAYDTMKFRAKYGR